MQHPQLTRLPSRLPAPSLCRTAVTAGSKVDIHSVVDTDEKIHEMHAGAEVFDRKSELTFK